LDERVDGRFFRLILGFDGVVEGVFEIDRWLLRTTELMGTRFSSLFRLGMTKVVS